ncbi:MAG: hypothetical protein IJP54_07870 [Synergistaceae bacterium]|nr:hypothetical protein [Synergistaceae bacterium]
MSRPYFTARHIESMALLPETLEVGRAYFVDDEQVIVIDHGRGPVIYGKSTGPQGAAGEPIPQLQDQIDKLAEASLSQSKTIWEINQRELDRHEQIQALISDTINTVKTEITTAMQEQSDRMDSALNILAKSIAELYPAHYPPEEADPLDNETVYTDSGAYTIQQTVLDDGTVILNLTPQTQVIDTLQTGDTVDFDGSTWTVENISTADGVTSITINPN